MRYLRTRYPVHSYFDLLYRTEKWNGFLGIVVIVGRREGGAPPPPTRALLWKRCQTVINILFLQRWLSSQFLLFHIFCFHWAFVRHKFPSHSAECFVKLHGATKNVRNYKVRIKEFCAKMGLLGILVTQTGKTKQSREHCNVSLLMFNSIMRTGIVRTCGVRTFCSPSPALFRTFSFNFCHQYFFFPCVKLGQVLSLYVPTSVCS